MSKCWIGIDVGKNGGIVIINSEGKPGYNVATTVTPTVGKKGKGQEIDKQGIKKMFKNYHKLYDEVIVVLEDVHSIFGVSAGSNFQFGRVLGILEGLLEALEIPYYKVSPKTWQGICLEGVPVMTKPGSKAKGRGAYDTKAMALVAAQRLYPTLDLRASERCKVAHDGIVDALLMAHYAKLKY